MLMAVLVAVAEVQVVQIAEAEASVRDEVAAERTARVLPSESRLLRCP